MAAITKIEAQLVTGNRSGAGTDGSIYVGIGGREFHLDSAIDDFERGSNRTYIMGQGAGEGSTINDVSLNDPRAPYQLRTENVDKFPVYIRFEPSNDDPRWNLEEVKVTVNPGASQSVYRALGGSDNLWLGHEAGKYCYLLKVRTTLRAYPFSDHPDHCSSPRLCHRPIEPSRDRITRCGRRIKG